MKELHLQLTPFQREVALQQEEFQSLPLFLLVLLLFLVHLQLDLCRLRHFQYFLQQLLVFARAYLEALVLFAD